MDNAKSQIITLTDRKQLSLTGVEKMISVKPDLLQLNTDFGTLQITGTAMEVSKLDLEEKVLEVKGVITSIKYLDDKKAPLFKRIFKWFIYLFHI